MNQTSSQDPLIPYPDFRQTFGLVALWFGANLMAWVFIAPVLRQFIRYESSIQQSFIQLITYVFAFGLVLIFGVRQKRYFEEADWRFSFRVTIWWVYAMVLGITLALIMPIDFLSGLIPMPEYFRKFFEQAFSNDLFSVTATVIAAPLMEELLFRGIVLDGFLKRFSPLVAIFWSSVCFGAAHLNPWQFIGAFILGILLGWTYWKTRSLWPCIFIHFVNNAVATVLTFLLDMEVETAQELFANDTIYYSAVSGSTIAAILLGLVLWQKTSGRKLYK